MEEILQYLKPEFTMLVIALYFLGIAFKRLRQISNNWIPLLLAGCGVFLAGLGVASNYDAYHNLAAAVFDAVTQGIVCAGMSVYINQLMKQCNCNEKTGNCKNDK